jgi:O-methyltransferase involved in polyketide biosynthesis
VHPPPSKQRRSVRLAGIGLGSPEHHRVQAVSILQHFFMAALNSVGFSNCTSIQN